MPKTKWITYNRTSLDQDSSIETSTEFGPFVTGILTVTTDYFISKKDGKDQESIQSSTTPDQGYQWVSETSQ